MYRKLLLITILLIMSGTIIAQESPEQIQKFLDDPYGDISFRKEGIMAGNQVRTLFYNNGEVGQWPFSPSGEWPKGTGHGYLDGVTVLISAEVEAPGNGQLVHPLEASYREWMDTDPRTGDIWGLEPVPFYTSLTTESPAMSSDSTTWPDLWPRALPKIDNTWDGYWYGYFGRGVINSDFETFFVMDDSKDKEYQRFPYYYNPVAADSNRGGLGLRVEVRGFQWSQILAEDIIFWHYDIVNLADIDYNKAVFGFYTDTGVGGTNDSGDDFASFDLDLDIAFGYDEDGKAPPDNWKTGYYGYAYLESPGIGNNGINDDNDVDVNGVPMVDERRDDGIDNDGDWNTYTDLNENGKWDADENEPLNSDVGTDGVGPFDPQYVGPDLDGTEGNGIPNAGEPNFDENDIDESDQIGLTSLSIYRLGDGGTGGGWPKDDESMWAKMNYQSFDTTLQNANISMVFASGPFPLIHGQRERFSMALLFGSNLEDLFFNKRTVQDIYDANYNFAKPPLKPHLTAVPSDGKVYLFWDDVAEDSRDPFMGYENNDVTQGAKKDFEGYTILRSREPEFNDIKIITDAKGEPKFYKPLAQFDKIDGIVGPDITGINGAHFWRGDDTGLRHSYVDTTVQNGVKYYYALVSYDMGDSAKAIVPATCTKIINEDFSGNVQFIDYNCAIVVPDAPAAGYLPPGILGDLSQVSEGKGTGALRVNIVNPAEVKDGAQYEAVFESSGEPYNYLTNSLSLVRSYEGSVDTISALASTDFGPNKFSAPFDGLVLTVINDSLAIDMPNTDWSIGRSNMTMIVRPDDKGGSRNTKWAADYEIRFFDEIVSYDLLKKLPLNCLVINTTTGDTVGTALSDQDNSGNLSYNDILRFVQYTDEGNPKFTWSVEFRYVPEMNKPVLMPVAGDVFVMKTNKPFDNGDYFSFNTEAASVDKDRAENDLDDIGVVPNPYVTSASWEKRNLNQYGRGERRIDFIHLPAKCTIRIFTMSGALVKIIDRSSSAEDGSESWNLVSDDGMDVAYGIYVYHVDAPGIGEHIGKFALIK
ncbi:MAG: hypothetical protein JEY94_11105 [Melioribacteraceae bacterium]|nr:hypothetical protein [Melioribacteraceae bacterium]